MNDVQEYLLGLVKEIDVICQKNDIDYYIFAGSMLGIERNEGFLPWDDDIDVVMTRKSYDKFKEAVKTQLPPNRVFEDKRSTPDYPLHFGKYTSTDSANIIRSLAFGDCASGFWIDIMYVSPMPSDPKKREYVKKWFPVLCELENRFYIEYPYRYEGFNWRYKLTNRLSSIVGRERVLNYLRKRCDNFRDEDCPDYFLYHSLDADFRIYSKECFGKPIRAKYENEMVNKSPANRKMCREAYGDSWMIVPKAENQDSHSTIMDCNASYLKYKNDYMQFIDHDEVMRTFSEIKDAHMEKVYRERKGLYSFYRSKAELIAMEIERNILANEQSLNELLEQKDYTAIGRLFGSYITVQWDSRIKKNNIYVPISDESLYAFLIYLICERQEFYSAAALMNLRRNDAGPEPAYFKELDEIVKGLKQLSIELWDNMNYERVIELCKENEEIADKLRIKEYHFSYCIAKLALGQPDEDVKQICLDYYERKDKTGIPEKLLGDICYDKGDIEEAMEFYKVAERRLRNGLLRLELAKRKEEMELEERG